MRKILNYPAFGYLGHTVYTIALLILPLSLTMSLSPSNNALIYAILALNSEISLQQDYVESDDVPDDEIENEEEILNDLEQAFMEFVEIYKQRCKADKELPSVEDLLSNEL